ncbi:MAG TPA: hypothetical protein VFQ35_05935 [Polyangiaceae bacterium]|nr:hypothetical protein [Polyangiaceae bacterium]
MIPVLPLALGAGLVALMFTGGKKGASSSSSSPGGGTAPPAGGGFVPSTTTPAGGKTAIDFQARILDALSRNSPDALMQIANEMDAAGLKTEAAALRVTASALRTVGTVAPSTAVPNPPIVTPPQIVLPPVVTPPVGPSPVPLPPGNPITSQQAQRLALAQQVAMHLQNTSRYKEDQALVKAFQSQEGLVVDGLYGYKSALALVSYGIVPPRPFYWRSSSAKADKSAYSKALIAQSVADPARAADWRAASKVENDPNK